jgi:hypothetical protein
MLFSLAGLAENHIYNILIGLTRNPDVGVTRNGRFSLKAADLHMIFEPSILKIIQLVKEQIAMCEKPVRSILLVGGFGESMYLRERLEIAIGEDTSIQKPLELLQPPNARLAVARGAAMKGVALAKPENYDIPMVTARRARKHYGYELGFKFDANAHTSLSSQKYWDGLHGIWRVLTMHWHIKRV